MSTTLLFRDFTVLKKKTQAENKEIFVVAIYKRLE